MSIEYFLYSFDKRPILANELINGLASSGWAVLVARGSITRSEYSIIESGSIFDFDIVVGSRDGEGALSPVRVKNKLQTESAFSDGSLGSCMVYAKSPYAPLEEMDDDMQTELSELYGSAYLDARLASAAKYGTRTSAGRSTLSVDLQVAVTKTLCSLRGGLFEDEISGTSQIVPMGTVPANVNW